MELRSMMRRFVSVCALVGIGTASAVAGACGEEIAPYVDYRVMGIASAERALQDGKHIAAAGMIVRMFPEIQRMSIGRDGLLARASRTLALATTRAGGALPALEREVPAELLGTLRGATEAERAENLAWSVSALRNLSEVRKNDPAVQTDLGEALAAVGASHDEARKLLEGLAGRDLVATPQGYAALGRLHAELGHGAEQASAVKRCEAMTKGAAYCAGAPAAGRSQG